VTNKKNILILFGGKSVEHEVSVISARNIVAALDDTKYNALLVGIDHAGRWIPYSKKALLENPTVTALPDDTAHTSVVPYTNNGGLMIKHADRSLAVDVVFPVLHGTMGEDGTMQGLLELANIPYIGPGVLGSAIGMDKDVTKRLLSEAKLPTAKYKVYKSHQKDQIVYSDIKRSLGMPCFVKPANAGSSVGVSKAYDEASLTKAVNTAFLYDTKILIETYIKGREVECSVLGNEQPIASVPGDIVVTGEFYSYDAKYLDEDGATLTIPAQISDDTKQRVQQLALQTFETLCCEGMARVDFFVTEDEDVYINEINTIPGFTTISMYPKLWEASGISYAELIDRLVQLALDRSRKRHALRTDY